MTSGICVLSQDESLPTCDGRLALLHRYWRSIRPATDLLPGRQHIDPCGMPRDLLRWIWLVDVQRAPLRFSYRLVGTGHAEAKECDRTGRFLDDTYPDFARSIVYPQFASGVEAQRLSYYLGPPVFHIKKDYDWTERLMMPLARNGRDVDMLLAITLFKSKSERAF
jgi:hypothetical protein